MNKYEVLKVLGEGAYGIVMKCLNKENGELVAIKKFKDCHDNPSVLKTTLREVKMLKLLKQENIIELKEAFLRKGRHYLVFEFMEENLLEVVQRAPSGFDPEAVRSIIWQLLKAVEFCHRCGVVHRDIKPENLLIDTSSKILKICDFGFARHLPGGSVHPSPLTEYVATRWYRAPELLVDRSDYGKEVDIWAIGCIMGEILDGQPLFPGESEMEQLQMIQQVLSPLPSQQTERLKHRQAEVLEVRYAGKACDQTIDFMKRLLALDPKQRLTGAMALQHPYFECLSRQRSQRITKPLISRMGICLETSLRASSHETGLESRRVATDENCPETIGQMKAPNRRPANAGVRVPTGTALCSPTDDTEENVGTTAKPLPKTEVLPSRPREALGKETVTSGGLQPHEIDARQKQGAISPASRGMQQMKRRPRSYRRVGEAQPLESGFLYRSVPCAIQPNNVKLDESNVPHDEPIRSVIKRRLRPNDNPGASCRHDDFKSGCWHVDALLSGGGIRTRTNDGDMTDLAAYSSSSRRVTKIRRQNLPPGYPAPSVVVGRSAVLGRFTPANEASPELAAAKRFEKENPPFHRAFHQPPLLRSSCREASHTSSMQWSPASFARLSDPIRTTVLSFPIRLDGSCSAAENKHPSMVTVSPAAGSRVLSFPERRDTSSGKVPSRLSIFNIPSSLPKGTLDCSSIRSSVDTSQHVIQNNDTIFGDRDYTSPAIQLSGYRAHQHRASRHSQCFRLSATPHCLMNPERQQSCTWTGTSETSSVS